jgi:hypothetical protein
MYKPLPPRGRGMGRAKLYCKLFKIIYSTLGIGRKEIGAYFVAIFLSNRSSSN